MRGMRGMREMKGMRGMRMRDEDDLPVPYAQYECGYTVAGTGGGEGGDGLDHGLYYAPFLHQVHLFELVLVVLLDPLVQLGAVQLQGRDLPGLLLNLQYRSVSTRENCKSES